jgi:hypothetical protein
MGLMAHLEVEGCCRKGRPKVDYRTSGKNNANTSCRNRFLILKSLHLENEKALICEILNRFPNMLKKSEFLNEYRDEFVNL